MAEPVAPPGKGSLLQEMGLTEEEIARRKEFLEFGEQDVQALRGLNPTVRESLNGFIDAFYQHLLAFEEGRRFFHDPQVLDHVKEQQRRYFLAHTEGNYDLDYVEDRLNVGAVHERIGLPVKSYLGMYSFYLRGMALRLFDVEADARDFKAALHAYVSLLKLVFLDIGFAIDTYIARRERVIREQQEAIRELPTPVLQIRDRLLIIPVVGALDSYRARLLTEQLLENIRTRRAKVVILDVTGVPVVDSKVANHLLQTVSAARLMGALTILTGLSPQIAQALVAIGVDLSSVRTTADLQGGIEVAERLLARPPAAAEDGVDHAKG